MLQALNERGELVIPSTLTNMEINLLRKHLFYCPQCKEKVIIRAGPKVVPHFAHLPESLCSLHTGGESNYHKLAKLILYEWFQSYTFSGVYLEKFLPNINQRPDILIKTKEKTIAVEFQSATISPKQLRQRNEGYAKESIIPLWIMGENQLKPLGKKYRYQINTFKQKLIQPYRHKDPTKLVYFCPYKRKFTVLNDFHFFRHNKAYAIPRVFYLHNIHFKQLFLPYHFPKTKLYQQWYEEKRRFRLSSHRVSGKELQFRQWLYEKKLHIEQLPSLIHLPIGSQFKMNTPLWQWQAKLVIDLLDPLKVGACITTSQCKHMIEDAINLHYKADIDEIIEQYFAYLIVARLFIEKNRGEWLKVRNFRFHSYIEASLQADRLLMNFLSQKEGYK